MTQGPSEADTGIRTGAAPDAPDAPDIPGIPPTDQPDQDPGGIPTSVPEAVAMGAAGPPRQGVGA